MSTPRTRLYVQHDLREGASLSLESDQAHYVQHVLRHKAGESLRLFNNHNGEWLARIDHLHKKKAELLVTEQLSAPLAVPDVWVLFAPIKYGKIDFLMQKVTELGAARIQPVMTDHTIVHRINYERLHANAVEAAQQCERTHIPEITEAVNLPQLLAEQSPYHDLTGVGVAWLLVSALAQEGVHVAEDDERRVVPRAQRARALEDERREIAHLLECRRRRVVGRAPRLHTLLDQGVDHRRPQRR